MKRSPIVALLFSLSLLLWGCPYQSNVPLSEASEPIDVRLLGQWLTEAEMKQTNPSYYSISEHDSLHYLIDDHQYNGKDSTYAVTTYEGHLTRIGEDMFMNVRKLDQKDKFFLFKVKIYSGQFVKYEVTDNIDEQFASSSELVEFVKKHKHLSFFFNRDEQTFLPKN